MTNLDMFKEEAKKRIDELTEEDVAKWLHNTISVEYLIEFLKKDKDKCNHQFEKEETVVRNLQGVPIRTRRCVLCGWLQKSVAEECEHDYEIIDTKLDFIHKGKMIVKKCKKCGYELKEFIPDNVFPDKED